MRAVKPAQPQKVAMAVAQAQAPIQIAEIPPQVAALQAEASK